MEPPFQIGFEIDVSIERLGFGGVGVAHPGGFALFVPRTAPGDRVRVCITDIRRRYGRARVKEILSASEKRVEPRCPHFFECGGCHVQHMETAFAAEQKVSLLEQTLSRFGPGEMSVEPIVVPKAVWNYRNRVTYHRDDAGRMGYISWIDGSVIDIPACPVADHSLNELTGVIRQGLLGISASVIPFVVLRRTTAGHRAVVLSISGDPPASLPSSLILDDDVSVLTTRVPCTCRSPFGRSFNLVKGDGRFVEEVGNVRFILRPDLFFQIHPEIASRLAHDVVKAVLSSSPENVLDVFCGAGLFTLALAAAGAQVLGVEIHHAAVEAAKASAEENDLSRLAAFRTGKAQTILTRLYREGRRFEAAVVDPPRSGLTPEVIRMLPKLGIRRLVYVSCSPPTLSRDLKALADMGFKADTVRPYEMFPQTYHVETLTSLSRCD